MAITEYSFRSVRGNFLLYLCTLYLRYFLDPPIISTNKNWVHTGKKSTITLRCHVCAEKPYKVFQKIHYLGQICGNRFIYLCLYSEDVTIDLGLVDQRQRDCPWIVRISYSNIFRPKTL